MGWEEREGRGKKEQTRSLKRFAIPAPQLPRTLHASMFYVSVN